MKHKIFAILALPPPPSRREAYEYAERIKARLPHRLRELRLALGLFDPTKPVNSAKIVAAELRSQFNSLKDLIDAVPGGSLLERHEYEFYADAIPAASGTIGHVTGSHGMLKIADGISLWRDLPYIRQVAPGGDPSAYAVTGCGDPSYNGIYHYRGIEPNGGTPYPSYELSSHRVLVFKSSLMAADGWQIGQHNDNYPRYFVSSGGDPSDPTAGVWSSDGVWIDYRGDGGAVGRQSGSPESIVLGPESR